MIGDEHDCRGCYGRNSNIAASSEGNDINKSLRYDLVISFMALLTSLMRLPVNIDVHVCFCEEIDFQAAAKGWGTPPCCPGRTLG